MTSSTEPNADSEPPIRVWIVEDHDILRKSLVRLCSSAQGIAGVQAFANAEAMLAAAGRAKPGEHPTVLLLDVGLPGRSGLDIIGDTLAAIPGCKVVILTVFEDETKIGTAISAGACGYLLKTARPEHIVAAIREAAGGGSPMSPAVAARVVRMLANLTKPAVPVSLSPRERDMLRLIVEGLTAKEIADRLGVSIHTTDTHTRHLFKKLGVHSRAAAVAKAIRERLA